MLELLRRREPNKIEISNKSNVTCGRAHPSRRSLQRCAKLWCNSAVWRSTHLYDWPLVTVGNLTTSRCPIVGNDRGDVWYVLSGMGTGCGKNIRAWLEGEAQLVLGSVKIFKRSTGNLFSESRPNSKAKSEVLLFFATLTRLDAADAHCRIVNLPHMSAHSKK